MASIHGAQGPMLDDEAGRADVRASCERAFYAMCWGVGINHACVTTPILYASSVLTNTAGQAGNAMLYGATLVCSLFLSSVLFAQLGPKRGLSLAMLMYTVYVLLFAVAATTCEKRVNGACVEASSLQMPINLLGGLVGGFGAGLLWTCQGAFFNEVVERLAAAGGGEKAALSSQFAGTFAMIFLAMECLVRALTTVLHVYVGLDFGPVFFLFSGVALVSSLLFYFFAPSMPSQEVKGSVCAKAFDVVALWQDPKLWLLQSTNITFGFAAAWLGGYVGRNIFSKALSSGFIGIAGALLSGFASILSKLLAPLAAKIGKGPVILMGSVAFFMLGFLSKFVGHPEEWGWATLIFYVCMGFGRAVYESTNKAIMADFFPGKGPSAFANVFVFSTGSSTVAFLLGTYGVTTPELYLLITFAALTFPCFVAASFLMPPQQSSP